MRLRPLTYSIPKALVPVRGRPFLEYELELLSVAGVDDVVLCVGNLGDKIENHFGDGKGFGVRIKYSYDGKELLGPIGALRHAEGLLTDAFFVTYGDAYLRLDYVALMREFLNSGKLGSMAVFRNEGRYGKSDVVVKNGRVVEYNKKTATPGMVWINFGVTALRKRALSSVSLNTFCDEESFYGGLVNRRQLLAFEVNERFYEIGTQDGLRAFGDFIIHKQFALDWVGQPARSSMSVDVGVKNHRIGANSLIINWTSVWPQ